jgi:uncharacterized heparinase superfamily protein
LRSVAFRLSWRYLNPLTVLLRYFHTLRYLKMQQILGRVWFRLARPRPDESSAPPVRLISGAFAPPARRQASLMDVETFRFLNHIGSLAEWGWDDACNGVVDQLPTKLWRYNQHYFDDLNASDAMQRENWHQSLLQRWVMENTPGLGTGWESYPTSLRIVNWVKWHCSGYVLPHVCVQSLAVQARWLTRRLERHILGNHLFANAKALVFAGCFFSGDEANAWLRQGLEIIRIELPEQVLPDGGNFERSPMYHAIFWEDLLDLINLSQAYQEALPNNTVATWREAVMRMQTWLHGMTHPDGEMAFFNDAAMGIAPSPKELTTYAERLGVRVHPSPLVRVKHFASSGYIRLASAQAVAFLDVAPVGPEYLPGHAHADTLSFELSLFGQRVVTNGGTSVYGTGTVRQLERGTAAHSTVTINGENSSEVWGGFRVAHRAYTYNLTIDECKECITVRCSHNGYRRLPGKPVHQREWQWTESSLVVTDGVSGSVEHAVARFHLHPDVKVVDFAPSGCLLALPEGQTVKVFVKQGTAIMEESYFAPEFGKRILRSCLAVELIDQRSQVCFLSETHY